MESLRAAYVQQVTAQVTARLQALNPDWPLRLPLLGDVLGIARIAAIQASKRTSELIPLCHPIPLTRVAVEFELDEAECAIRCTVTAETVGRTGVEMEALTAVNVGLLTIYDMCKAVDRGMRMEGIQLMEKLGGKSGHWKA